MRSEPFSLLGARPDILTTPQQENLGDKPGLSASGDHTVQRVRGGGADQTTHLGPLPSSPRSASPPAAVAPVGPLPASLQADAFQVSRPGDYADVLPATLQGIACAERGDLVSALSAFAEALEVPQGEARQTFWLGQPQDALIRRCSALLQEAPDSANAGEAILEAALLMKRRGHGTLAQALFDRLVRHRKKLFPESRCAPMYNLSCCSGVAWRAAAGFLIGSIEEIALQLQQQQGDVEDLKGAASALCELLAADPDLARLRACGLPAALHKLLQQEIERRQPCDSSARDDLQRRIWQLRTTAWEGLAAVPDPVEPTVLRAAQLSDATQLSELAFHGKEFWPYDSEYVDLCRQELAVSRSTWKKIGSPCCATPPVHSWAFMHLCSERVSGGLSSITCVWNRPISTGVWEKNCFRMPASRRESVATR
jgi:hypothetical protein